MDLYTKLSQLSNSLVGNSVSSRAIVPVKTQLPTELWYDILDHALRPRFALDCDSSPKNLQYYYNAITIHYFSNSASYEERGNRKILRSVCRFWKDIIDSLRGSTEWIRPFGYREAHKAPPASRVDFYVSSAGVLRTIAHRYPHILTTLSVQFQYQSEKTNRPLFGCLLSRPSQLRVLHISFIGGTPQTYFVTQYLDELPLLETLSIACRDELVLDGLPILPRLKNFFLSQSKSAPGSLDGWNFISLQNLSLDSRPWPREPHNSQPLPTPMLDFLKRHAPILKSLRILPFEGIATSDPNFWDSLPSLECLTTDFIRYKYNIPTKSLPKALSHIVQLTTTPVTPSEFGQELKSLLQRVPKVVSLGLSVDPVTTKPIKVKSWMGSREIHRLEGHCRRKGIELLDEEGYSVDSISSTMERQLYSSQRWGP